ncbi:MAG TPA: hypothetical protein DHW87_04880 [Fervidobacterium sp.]|nr:hypothetical protein [Fervidobacterium sp.]HCL99082.1 hypothetical protein [Fervidobacterium sp.]HUM75370.1 hypothetical protein [Fervidobacterium sp.]
MKVEFYALFLFIVTVTILLFITFQKRVIIVEEVLPSPFVFVTNPYEKRLKERINQINTQLLFLEYNLKIPPNIDDLRILESTWEQIDDPRAVKSITKRVRKYWWGYGIENTKFKIKHIEIVWWPEVFVNVASKNTFGDALYEALNGKNISFNSKNIDLNVVQFIAEKYGVVLK